MPTHEIVFTPELLWRQIEETLESLWRACGSEGLGRTIAMSQSTRNLFKPLVEKHRRWTNSFVNDWRIMTDFGLIVLTVDDELPFGIFSVKAPDGVRDISG